MLGEIDFWRLEFVTTFFSAGWWSMGKRNLKTMYHYARKIILRKIQLFNPFLKYKISLENI